MFNYKGSKIQLRPLRPDDKERSIIWRNDPEIRDMALSYRFPVTDVMEDTWYRKALTGEDESKVYFSIENLNDGKHIGFVHLYNIDYLARVAYFGVVIGDKTEHGKGKATEAMHILFCFAFLQLNLRKLNLEVASFNYKALSLYEMFGFKREGILKQQIFISGKYYDKHSMCIFRDEYFEKYPHFKHHEIKEGMHDSRHTDRLI